MAGDPLELAMELRGQIAAALGIVLLSACESAAPGCQEPELDCTLGTTSAGEELGLGPARGPSGLLALVSHATDASSSGTTGGGSGGATSDGATGGDTVTSGGESGFFDPMTRVTCIDVPADGCPEQSAPCLERLMEDRHGGGKCSCVDGFVFGRVLAGPDSEVADACCYEIELLYEGCTPGRPFVVEGSPRTAPVASRGDWAEASPGACVEDVVSEETAEGEAWLEAARMEHASIAAFARVVLQLCSLGAPAEILEATQAALADEIRHARDCFSMASQLLGRKVGPGPLSLSGALAEAWTVRAFVRDLLIEGCVGETVAAGLARLQSRQHPRREGKAVLSRIARDETRHAALAFRTLRWLMTTEHADVARTELADFVERVSKGAWASSSADEERIGIAGSTASDRRRVADRIRRSTVVPLLRAIATGHAGRREGHHTQLRERTL